MVSNALAELTSVHGNAVLAATHDADEVVAACTGALRPHDLHLRGRRARLDTRLAHVPLRDVSVNRLEYGADVTVVPATPEEDNFLLTLPVGGSAEFRYGDVVAPATSQTGVIVGPYRDFEFSIDAAFDQVIVRLDRSRVEGVAAAMTGVVGPVHFDLALAPGVRRLDGLLESAVGLAATSLAVSRPQLIWQLEQVVIETLLLCQPSNRQVELGVDRAATSIRVRLATEFMMEHLAEPLSMTAVAAASGTTVRSLQAAFRRELDTSPTQWLKRQRLERAHALLESGGPGATVTDVAYSCGFFHLGEFGTAFKERYGMPPSALLTARH